MNKLALNCHSHNFRYNPKTKLFTVGKWEIGKKQTKSLIGKKVILVENGKSPAYLGGTIVNFIPVANAKNYKRTVQKFDIVFRLDPKSIGDTSAVDHPGWGGRNRRSFCYV